MHRTSTIVGLLFTLGGLAACGGSTASEEPDVSEFESLAVGDQVTVRCRFQALNPSGSLLTVKDCRIAS